MFNLSGISRQAKIKIERSLNKIDWARVELTVVQIEWTERELDKIANECNGYDAVEH